MELSMSVFPPIIYGTLREHYILLFGAAGAVATGAGFVGAWFGARLAGRSAMRQLDEARRTALQPEQVRELSANVEAIAIEVERIAEAQRFVAKVLVERHDALPAIPPRRPASEITPH
jgi:hypothetical protein